MWCQGRCCDLKPARTQESEEEKCEEFCLGCPLTMAEDVAPYFFLSSCALYWCMCLLQILGIYRFNKVWARGLPIIDKRYPRFVMVEAVGVCFYLAIVYPALQSGGYGYPDISGEWWDYLRLGLIVLTALIVPCIEVCRLWLISYDLQYLNSSRHQQWKTEIDASYAEKDWYLRNRGKWGNRQYVVRMGLVFYFIPTTLGSVLFLMDKFTGIGGFSVIPLGIGALVFNITPLYLYMKTPRNLQDQLMFHFEFKWTAFVFAVGVFGWIITGVLPRFVLNRFSHPYVGLTLTGCITAISQVMPSFLSTLVIPYKVNAMSEWNGITTPRIDIKQSRGTFQDKLKEILKDEKNCEAFVDWMYREFCGEAMLSFLECVQFRKYVEKEIGKTDGGGIGGNDDSFDFKLYDGMPKSSIVYDPVSIDKGGNDEANLAKYLESGSDTTDIVLMRCRRIADLLFKKYIEKYSEHEINISAQLRHKYADLKEREYDGMGLEQFLTFYDDVISEMIKYQAQSHRRYESSVARFA